MKDSMQNANTKKHDDEGLLPRKLNVKKPNFKSGLRSPTGEYDDDILDKKTDGKL